VPTSGWASGGDILPMQRDPVMQPSKSCHNLDRACRISSSSLWAADGRRMGFRRANGEVRRRKTPPRPRSAPRRRAVLRHFPRHPHSIPSLCMCVWSGTQTEQGSDAGSLRAENACRISCAPHCACACELTRPLAIASTRKQLAIAGTGLLMLSIFKTIFGLIA
jgi:hypothetical protein